MKLWIIIEGGAIFEGTLDMFKDCFIEKSKATCKTVRQWCAYNNLRVEFVTREVAETAGDLDVVLACHHCGEVLGIDRYKTSPYTGKPVKGMAWHPTCYEQLQRMIAQAGAQATFEITRHNNAVRVPKRHGG